VRVDLRNIRSPIIVFCSWGDDITPPPQALHWILDLYQHEQEIIEAGQTIVYCLHQDIGHLGIFVSGRVASKEHGEFAQAMDLIDVAPPGLYEAVIENLGDAVENPHLVKGDYLFYLEQRSLNDIRALGSNTQAENLRFAAAARASEINLGIYRAILGPYVRATANEYGAELSRRLHPNRMRFELFSDRNPFMQSIATLADAVRADRHRVEEQNPWTAWERQTSDWVVQTLDFWTMVRDRLQESIFHATYGSPLLQALIGLGETTPMTERRMGRDLAREAAAARVVSDLRTRIEQGGLVEAGVRAMIFIRMAEGRIDERAFGALEQIATERKDRRMSLPRFKEIVREQYLLLLLAQEPAVAALPKLLPDDPEERQAMLDCVRRVVTARGPLPEDGLQRLARIEALFETAAPQRSGISQTRKPSHRAANDDHAA
jgi:hypothetical protein